MNRNTFEKYVQEFCKDLALKHNNFAHKQHHSCILTYENVIISSGVNINLKNDFTSRYNSLKCLHAEAVTIMRALKKHYKILSKCELWVCRVGKVNKLSKPCPMCRKIIKTFNIHIIHYTNSNGEWITEFV